MHAIHPTAHDGLAAPADAGTALGHRLGSPPLQAGGVYGD